MSAKMRHGGFSLIEVMVAILILGVAIVGLTHGITTALASGKQSEFQTQAAMLAAGQIETLRADGQLVDGDETGDFGDDFPLFQWKQTIAPGGVEGLHEVTVTVENAKTGQSVYDLTTMLFEVPDETGSKKDKAARKGEAKSE
ncbi:MAG: hypothetical protein JWM68_4743 [Verrucomicrobiales bacterium]|nr:hypothetical protein [Verrucomicrobiales bacterium]